jgi:predicted metalloendopeptidase
MLYTDKHAPAFLRVNLVVAQMPEWYEAFEIGAESPMYIPPEHRITIF